MCAPLLTLQVDASSIRCAIYEIVHYKFTFQRKTEYIPLVHKEINMSEMTQEKSIEYVDSVNILGELPQHQESNTFQIMGHPGYYYSYFQEG